MQGWSLGKSVRHNISPVGGGMFVENGVTVSSSPVGAACKIANPLNMPPLRGSNDAQADCLQTCRPHGALCHPIFPEIKRSEIWIRFGSESNIAGFAGASSAPKTTTLRNGASNGLS